MRAPSSHFLLANEIMKRREFLSLSGTFAAVAIAPGLISACGVVSRASDHSHFVSFEQGVASGDPRPDSVVIWTRAAPQSDKGASVTLVAEVSLTETFDSLVLQQEYAVNRDSDFTLRVIVKGLQPDTNYFYRFIAHSETVSPTGRTWTAPEQQSNQALKFAVVSCQDWDEGFYSGYRRMVLDDLAATSEEQIRFVLHLGDFIYETRPLTGETTSPDLTTASRRVLRNTQGELRQTPPFPDGQTAQQGFEYAHTLADYRHLYKTYLTDPDLQAARARWPFICIWDDHEFSDDCWQTEANYQSDGFRSELDEPSQQRKVAANQAWFEYIPANLSDIQDIEEDLVKVHDFEFVAVNNTKNQDVDETNFVDNEDNRAAIYSMTIYRNFRFGQLFELILTDNRSYRSDHPIPEDISGNYVEFIHPRSGVPVDLVNTLDAGDTANNDSPPKVLSLSLPTANPRLNSPPGTMLGHEQKAWWKSVMQKSSAHWKIWANSIPLCRFLINLSHLDDSLSDVIASSDTWDGYPSERKELMQFILEQNITNVVSLAGDVHAHYAGTVMQDYDMPVNQQQAVMPEFVCAAMSSISQFQALDLLSVRENPSRLEQQLRQLVLYEINNASDFGGQTTVNNLNNTILNGIEAGIVAARTNDIDLINAAKHHQVNAHLSYADTDAHGYGLVKITSDNIQVKLVTIDHIDQDPAAIDPQLARTAQFTVSPQNQQNRMIVEGPTFTGTPPFPFS